MKKESYREESASEYENRERSKKRYWKNNVIEESKTICVDENSKRNEVIKNK